MDEQTEELTAEDIQSFSVVTGEINRIVKISFLVTALLYFFVGTVVYKEMSLLSMRVYQLNQTSVLLGKQTEEFKIVNIISPVEKFVKNILAEKANIIKEKINSNPEINISERAVLSTAITSSGDVASLRITNHEGGDK